MTEAELAQIEARASAATPGPWEIRTDSAGRSMIDSVLGDPVVWQGGTYRREDTEFIAHAREDIPRLIALVRDTIREG